MALRGIQPAPVAGKDGVPAALHAIARHCRPSGTTWNPLVTNAATVLALKKVREEEERENEEEEGGGGGGKKGEEVEEGEEETKSTTTTTTKKKKIKKTLRSSPPLSMLPIPVGALPSRSSLVGFHYDFAYDARRKAQLRRLHATTPVRKKKNLLPAPLPPPRHERMNIYIYILSSSSSSSSSSSN